jgi:DNA phosphorothioation-dependent restriction protein DptH
VNKEITLITLAEGIANWVEKAMAREIATLRGEKRECRAVFCGPHKDLLQRVFDHLIENRPFLEAKNGDGQMVRYPVILQVEDLPPGKPVGSAIQSGCLPFHGLASVRNDRSGVFLVLVEPGAQASGTHESTRTTLGVETSANDGSASIAAWWADPFIQSLIDSTFSETSTEDSAAAKELVRESILAADAAEQHDISRAAAWGVIERLWLFKANNFSGDQLVGLAAGFPPSADGALDSRKKLSVLSAIVDRIESENYGGLLSYLVEKAKDEDERTHIRECIANMRQRCEVVTAIRRCAPFAYTPIDIAEPPSWWNQLTVERWEELLDAGVIDDPVGDITIECVNPIISHLKGMVPVVKGPVHLRVQVSEHFAGKYIQIVRDAPGSKAAAKIWAVEAEPTISVEDDAIPKHKGPLKYSAFAAASPEKKATVRVISLEGWLPGVIVSATTATRGAAPKRSKPNRWEASLALSGQGRHYLDVFLSPGAQLSSMIATGSDEDGNPDPGRTASIGMVADGEFGLEIEVESEGFVDILFQNQDSADEQHLRVGLSAEQASPEECSSHFELQLLKNSSGRRPSSVHVNAQVRIAQLQGWMLEEGRARQSYYPFVLAADYAVDWHRRDWTAADDVIFSTARFLCDPRPTFEEMLPPQAFLDARTILAARIRGKDGNGLVEGAPLGEWMATDTEFAAQIDSYLKSYMQWLSSDPGVAVWCDIGLVARLESNGLTLVQEPEAVLMSPLHPVRLAWHCIAQRALFLAARKRPCPAASIIDPDCIPDALTIPMRNAMGGRTNSTFFSVECNSDYWSILWNANRLESIPSLGASAPLDRELGLVVGGISSGFSVSQVHKALEDICSMLVAKPVIGVLVSSTGGQNNACNEGLLSWGRKYFGSGESTRETSSWVGANEIRIYDDRPGVNRPDDAEISNLAEDTSNAVHWYEGTVNGEAPDLAIIAQLETSNPGALPTKLASPLGFGGLVRARIREPSSVAGGQLIRESRMSAPAVPSGDGLADTLASAISSLENISDERLGYVFAPSVHAIKSALDRAEFAAVSSSSVDPACFLGSWLEGTYLWDYELPAYSGRAGDSNGYYLLSRIKELDLETLKLVIRRFPGCEDLREGVLTGIVEEVARRGIPTVRGLAAGDSGATGDLGLLIATRLLQDSFRNTESGSGLITPWGKDGEAEEIGLVIPVDPFKGYLNDLAKALTRPTLHRPDLLVALIRISDTTIQVKLTPIEVKNRSAVAAMSSQDREAALAQAKSLGSLFEDMRNASTEDQEMVLWRIAHQNLLTSMLGYGFRVYSQRLATVGKSGDWSSLHARVIEGILSSRANIEIDTRGRLIVIDGSPLSGPKDTDGDGFQETIELSHTDAALFIRGEHDALCAAMKERLGSWEMSPTTGLIPATAETEARAEQTPPPQPEASGIKGAHAVFTASNDEPFDLDVEIKTSVSVSPALELGASFADATTQKGLTIRVGETMDGFESKLRRLNLGDTALNQMNMGVVGDLGTGKTQLLQSLIFQIVNGKAGNREVDPNILIFDYKKDYASSEFVSAVSARVLRPQHLPLNLFDLSTASQSINPKLERYKFFSDVLDKIYPGIGPKQRDRLKNAIKESYAEAVEGQYPTIYDVHRNYVDALNGGADSLSGILGDLVDMELFTPDPSAVVSSADFLRGVVVISLNELGSDDRTKNMLVAIMLNVFYEHMLRIPKRPFLGPNRNIRVLDSMLLVDEADNIMRYEFDVLRRVLLQGREFGVGVILASQYLSHFKTGASDYREPLLSWFIHKVPHIRPQELSALGLSDSVGLPELAERIRSLGVHECLYKTHNVPGEFIRGAPFYRRGEWNDG